MHRGRARGARILDPAGPLEAQVRRCLQDKGCREILLREPAIEMTKDDLVHIAGRNAGVGKGLSCNAYDQAFDCLPFEPTKRGMGPPNNASGHCDLLVSLPRTRLDNGCDGRNAA